MPAGTSGADAVEAYLAAVPQPQRRALEDLRKLIRAAAPDADEALVYGAPGFRRQGALVCYAAGKDGCSFYPMSPPLLDSLGAEIEPFRSSKGTLDFTADRPLDAALVRRIVAARLAEKAARGKRR